jgi:molybdopterin converting factor subunit 1
VRVNILFFGLLRDLTGRSSEDLDVAAGATLEAIFDTCAARFPRLKEARSSLLIARNHEFAHAGDVAAEGDEIAFLPPVSGGAGPRYSQRIDAGPEGSFFALTHEPIDTEQIARQVLRPNDGALVRFDGVVRNHSNGRQTRFLEYQCYEPMAVKIMAALGREIAAKYPIGRIVMVHRLGRVEIGEASVVVAVGSPHRQPAFEAALEGINRLKKTVPVWKKEHFADGEVWVEGEWDESLPRL